MRNQVIEHAFLAKPNEVRAMLAGTQTQMRRIVKSKNGEAPPAEAVRLNQVGKWFHLENTHESAAERDQFGPCLKMWTYICPYGQPGDRLWVREPFGFDHHAEDAGKVLIYRADYDGDGLVTSTRGQRKVNRPWGVEYEETNSWYSSTQMRREHSRLLLEITGVRCERLQDISEADAVAEGIEAVTDNSPFDGPAGWLDYSDKYGLPFDGTKPILSYKTLWESINGPDSWAANPWVWVVEFKVVPNA